MVKEIAVRLVPKEHVQFFKDDESFVRRIAHDISANLAERILSILISEGEIIVRQSDLRVEEQKMLNQVEYRQNIMWTPLVRCKDCKHSGKIYSTGGYIDCAYTQRLHEPDFYCADGERKDGADDAVD